MDPEFAAYRLLLDQIADKWTILILSTLCRSGGEARFGAVLKALPDLPQKSLSQCLRRLERNGFICRKVLDTVPIGVSYHITPLGHSLEGPFKALNEWADTYVEAVEQAQREFDIRARHKLLEPA
jgi:DNA-binding HxlR family transcriptional regulator